MLTNGWLCLIGLRLGLGLFNSTVHHYGWSNSTVHYGWSTLCTNGCLYLIGLGLGLFNSTVHHYGWSTLCTNGWLCLIGLGLDFELVQFTMVGAHCVRDKGANAHQWLIASDWLRLGVRHEQKANESPSPHGHHYYMGCTVTVDRSWSRSPILTAWSRWIPDLFDLYDLAHVARWEPYNVHDRLIAHVSWVGSGPYRSFTSHTGRLGCRSWCTVPVDDLSDLSVTTYRYKCMYAVGDNLLEAT